MSKRAKEILGIIAAVLVILFGIGAFVGNGAEDDAQAMKIPTATPTKVAQSRGDHLEYGILSASLDRRFPAPMSLYPLEDGRSYLIVTMRITNKSNDEASLNKDSFRVLVDNEKVDVAGDVVEQIDDRLDLKAMGSGWGSTRLKRLV